MSTEPEDDVDYQAVLKDRFAQPDRLAARRKAERRAGMTPAQRARRGPPKQQINFRGTNETKSLLDALAEHLDTSQGDVVERALRALAKATPGFGGRE